MPKGVERLTRQEVRNVARNQFASFYLTLVSIIESLVLTTLLEEVDKLTGMTPLYQLSPTILMQIGVAFLLVLYVWHEYVIGLICFQWVIGFIDSVIPLLFGCTQLWLVHNIGTKSADTWFSALLAFQVVGMVAYANMFLKAHHNSKERPENARILLLLGPTKFWTLVLMGLWAVSAVVGIIASYARGDLALCWATASTLVIAIMFGVRGWRMWRIVSRRCIVRTRRPS